MKVKTKKIKMTDSRKIAGYGLKQTGLVWSPPFDLGEQLCRQKFAVPVDTESRSSTTRSRTVESKGE